jgi:hypothetical protein
MNESTTQFWVDWWCGQSPLRVRFSSLFSTIVEPGAYVDMYHGEDGWRIQFAEPLHYAKKAYSHDVTGNKKKIVTNNRYS